MGIGFVIILQLIAVFILSIIIAIFAGITTYFLSKEKRKRKVFLALISPFVGLYTLYFAALFGAIAISVIKNVDVGIGDAGYVPIIDNCELRFIDSPEYTYVANNGETIISDISQIQQIDHRILGKTKNDEYFLFDIKTNELKKFNNKIDLTTYNPNVKLELVESFDFYVSKRNETIGILMIIIRIIAIMITGIVLYLLRKLILGFEF